MDSNSIMQMHLIKLVNANNSTVRKYHSTSFKIKLLCPYFMIFIVRDGLEEQLSNKRDYTRLFYN